MTIGRKLKPVTCPVLAGLLVWVDARNGEGDQMGRLDGPGVAHLADALEQVLPLTRPCTWHDLVAEFATTARAAANVRGSLVFG